MTTLEAVTEALDEHAHAAMAVANALEMLGDADWKRTAADLAARRADVHAAIAAHVAAEVAKAVAAERERCAVLFEALTALEYAATRVDCYEDFSEPWARTDLNDSRPDFDPSEWNEARLKLHGEIKRARLALETP